MIAQYVSKACKILSQEGMEAYSSDQPGDIWQLCHERQPEVLHLHGCRPVHLLKAAAQARRMGVRIVISPHGQLQPWELDHASQSQVRQLVSHAYALIAQSRMEKQALAELGWNDRIETIANPLITQSTSQTEWGRALATVYQKVMASDVLELIDEESRRALQLLLKAGLTGDRRWLGDNKVASPDWQRLYVYATQEGVGDLLTQGIKVMQLEAPQPVPSPIYLPNAYKRPEPSGILNIIQLVQLAKEETDTGRLSLLRLSELYQALRSPHLDEEVLLQELSLSRLKGFFASILQILVEQMALDEGFMPCKPQDNNETKRIITIIHNHLKI